MSDPKFYGYRNLVEAEGLRHYQLRSYVLHRLDKAHFDALNEDNHVSQLNGYCLDALDQIPAGCSYDAARLPTQRTVHRGRTQAEQDRIDEFGRKFVAELIAELKARGEW